MNPILTIVTRHMVNKRKHSIKRMLESIACMNGKIQHLIIEDDKEIGHPYISQLLVNRCEEAIGEYIWMLDDDDVCTCPQLPKLIERIHKRFNSDVIMTKSLIHRGEYFAVKEFGNYVFYPYTIMPEIKLWGTNLKDYPKLSISIMTPITKSEIWKECLPAILGQENKIDWYLFDAIRQKVNPEKIYYLDYLVGWQPMKYSTEVEQIIDGDIMYG